MFDLSTLSAFIVVVIGLFLIPGPAVFLTITRAAQGGQKMGIMTGLGIATGDLIHALLAAVGFSAILMTSALAFNVVKFVGAAYLLYMGIRSIFAKASASKMPEVTQVSASRAYGHGILVEVLNPKTALFFLAFFPQFVNPEKGSTIAQFLTLGLIFVVMCIIYTTILAIGTGAIGQWMKRGSSGFGRWGGKFVGVVYIVIGLRVVFQSR